MDNWSRVKEQPLILNVTMEIEKLDERDNLKKSVNYSTINNDITKTVKENQSIKTIHELAQKLSEVILKNDVIKNVELELRKPRALLLADYASCLISRGRDHKNPTDLTIIKNLNLNAIIGLYSWERQEKQRLTLSLIIHLSEKSHDYRTICNVVYEFVDESKFKTLEALALAIAKTCVVDCLVPKITVQIYKPNANTFADSTSVEVTRTFDDFNFIKNAQHLYEDVDLNHTAFIALGTNEGNRSKNLELAISKMNISNLLKVKETSFLYETEAMYVKDQPMFLNAVVKVSTSMDPKVLLRYLQNIEKELGREALGVRVTNGPRPIDLDILYFDDLTIHEKDLIIPHARVHEREFVLRPLVDIAPNLEHPVLCRTSTQLLSSLEYNFEVLKEEERENGHPISTKPAIYKVYPIGDKVWKLCNGPTILMGILNVTSDSFSDGMNLMNSSEEKLNMEKVLLKVEALIEDGAGIIDIGGQSTRPGADEVSLEVELERVIPVIKAIRNDPKLCTISISVDTYRPAVAAAALEAGCDMINDVTGGLGFVDDDEGDLAQTEMIKLWAKTKSAVCIMHMKGSPKTMQSKTDYRGEDITSSIKRSLQKRVELALSAGVLRWKILIDPGIGFAKTVKQNFKLLRDLKVLVSNGHLKGFPLLVGPSRKGFIGAAVNSKDPKDNKRLYGTAGACSVAIASGAVLLLRVHDVKEISSVVAVADCCFNPNLL
ncbi:trifunctional dihydropteroate synthetase [Clydaea vesicula]|uniref:Trifunctional dihydropteroate synthetase n=1 Tax=Clydaea vesicula TaxID=447962 RepID=A0AAD5U8X2_9FUNG|nr:trifunctional dihydropteroate synthetase [Clydaea vesicula]